VEKEFGEYIAEKKVGIVPANFSVEAWGKS
jgi:hypothetical protein